MTAFEYGALWNKAKVFIDRALVARDDGRGEEYHLWAALALELLGKASLSHVHPALIADPTHFPSMLAAVGRQQTADVKSITARTLFSRLRDVVDAFDDRMQRESNGMAERRNADLHSGESPLIGLEDRVWVPAYWRIVKVLVTHQGRTLADLLGGEEAARIDEVVRNNAEVTRQTVLARIARRSVAIDLRYGVATPERAEAAQRAAARPLPVRFGEESGAFEDGECPACHMKGWLFGTLDHEDLVEVDEGADPEWGPMSREVVEITYSTERFLCSECGLVLDGHEELEIAGMPSEFVHEEEHEPDYEPEYGND
jgi:hypothetical protein